MPFSSKKLAALLFLLLLFCKATQAQNTSDIDIQQDWITQQQQKSFEEKQRNQEFEALEKELQNKKMEDEKNKEASQLVTGKMKTCIILKEIHLIEANSLSYLEQKRITAPFIGKCIEADVLANIIKILNTYYQERGYVTTQIKIPSQNLQSGIFEIQIIEGKIEKISLSKDRIIDKMQKFTAFGNAEGQVLNINEINQGIYQINRLQSNQAVMKVEPGTESGNSIIKIDNEKKFPIRLTISRDNLGNQFTGIQRSNFSLNLDNLLFLNDNLNLNYTINANKDRESRYIESFSSSASIPFKYSTFSFDYLCSNFKSKTPGQTIYTTLLGFSQSSKLAIDHVLLSNSIFRLAANSSLTTKYSVTYNNNIKSFDSERRLSILNFGLTFSYYNKTNSIYLNPSYAQGIRILDATSDSLSRKEKAEFNLFKLYSNFSTKLLIPKINLPLTFNSEFSGQYSKQTLYGSEQFSVGGYYSVRGFRENYINGDSGYYIRNKLNLNLASLLEKSWNKAPNFLTKNLNKFSIEPFYDYGYVKYKNTNSGSDGRLSGAGIKSLFNSKYFNASLTYSLALNSSQLIKSNVKENRTVYFEISSQCC